jgi:hypothetical protein
MAGPMSKRFAGRYRFADDIDAVLRLLEKILTC